MKKEKGKKKTLKKTKEATSNPPDDDKNDPFDFGGMPKIDLKKNLGCG